MKRLITLLSFLIPLIGFTQIGGNTVVSTTSVKSLDDYYLELAKGEIIGHEGFSKWGENPDIDVASGFEHIWDGGGTYVPPTQARLHDVASTSANDVGTILSSGTCTSGSITTLIDGAASFTFDGINIGDIVLNDANVQIAVVTSVTNDSTITFLGKIRNPDTGALGKSCSFGNAYRIITNASIGGSLIYIKGLNASLLALNEFVVLNGISNVTTTGSYLRQFRSRVFGPNTSGAIGLITSTAQVDGTVSCQIINGNNQSLMAVYTVASDETGYLNYWWAAISKKQSATSIVRLRAGIIDKIGYVLQIKALNTTGTSNFPPYEPLTPLPIPGGTDIWIEADTDANDLGISSGFNLILVKN